MKNLFCLAPSVHKYHENAYFALKPVEMSEDETSLTLRFCWLPCINNPPEMRISTKPNISPTGDRRENGSKVVRLWNVKTEKKICSGDQIVMRTVDKEKYPLPDPALLNMQWVLHALTALSAGAEPVEKPDSDEDEDEDEDVPVFALSSP